ncbi:hypothetical protein ACWDZ8_25675 [Streptomyces sp. NPDC003233]
MPGRAGRDDVFGLQLPGVEAWAREPPEPVASPLEVLARLHRSYPQCQSRMASWLDEHVLSVVGACTSGRRTRGEADHAGVPARDADGRADSGV